MTKPSEENTAAMELYEFNYDKYGEHVVAMRHKGGGVQLFDTVKLFAEKGTRAEYERVKEEAAIFAKKFVAQFNGAALASKPAFMQPSKTAGVDHVGDKNVVESKPSADVSCDKNHMNTKAGATTCHKCARNQSKSKPAADAQKVVDGELLPCPFPGCDDAPIKTHSKDKSGGITIECGKAVHYIHPSGKGHFRNTDKGANNAQ